MIELNDIPAAWRDIVAPVFMDQTFLQLIPFLEQQTAQGLSILPPESMRFSALAATPPEQVKVLILGQDPYPTAGHAHGLAFSVQKEVTPLPRSLRNIYRELQGDLGIAPAKHGYLQQWAEQGVLLLNTVLSVVEGQAGSHQKKGWEALTDAIIKALNEQPEPMVFILWGKYAQKKAQWIDQHRHYLIESAHPSPLSAKRGFFDSHPFSQSNAFLKEKGRTPIDWCISP